MASSFFRYILFADDTNLFASGKHRDVLLSSLKSELGKLSDWFAHNKLTLNYGKTQFINFSKPVLDHSVDRWDLRIDGQPIMEVESSKTHYFLYSL